MIIDAHTHFTTAPAQLQAYRGQQITNLAKPVKAKLQISDEEVARSMQGQLNRMKESGIDRLLFSPQAGAERIQGWICRQMMRFRSRARAIPPGNSPARSWFTSRCAAARFLASSHVRFATCS